MPCADQAACNGTARCATAQPVPCRCPMPHAPAQQAAYAPLPTCNLRQRSRAPQLRRPPTCRRGVALALDVGYRAPLLLQAVQGSSHIEQAGAVAVDGQLLHSRETNVTYLEGGTTPTKIGWSGRGRLSTPAPHIGQGAQQSRQQGMQKRAQRTTNWSGCLRQ